MKKQKCICPLFLNDAKQHLEMLNESNFWLAQEQRQKISAVLKFYSAHWGTWTWTEISAAQERQLRTHYRECKQILQTKRMISVPII